MQDEPIWLFTKVMCVVAYVYIAATLACCLPWLFGVRRSTLQQAKCRVRSKDALVTNGVQAESA